MPIQYSEHVSLFLSLLKTRPRSAASQSARLNQSIFPQPMLDNDTQLDKRDHRLVQDAHAVTSEEWGPSCNGSMPMNKRRHAVIMRSRKAMKTATGTVKWISYAKGYGFILPDEGGEEIFAHFSAIEIEGYRTFIQGQNVEFKIQQGPKGWRAASIRPSSV